MSTQITLSLSPTTATQNTRLICPLDSATGKMFNTYFQSSPTTRPKRQPFLQMGLQERGYLYLGYASPGTQNGSSVQVLCWRLYLLCQETYFGFGFRNGSPVGDSLNVRHKDIQKFTQEAYKSQVKGKLTSCQHVTMQPI